jgi:HD-GYP domain-containing protein (c-di-GMP phosphodiesterase class II)
MNTATRHPETAQPLDIVRERCRALNLVTVACDAEGKVRGGQSVDAPTAEKIARDLFTSPLIRSLLAEAAAAWGEDEADGPRATEIFDGLWATPLADTRRRRRIGYLVCFALTPEALRGEHFEAACQSAHLDARAVREAMTPLASFDRAGVARVARLLNWTSQDRAEIASDEAALSGFSRQLTESYEEISLLHKLGRSMNEVTNPRRFVQLLCDELHATLTFRWIAVRFLHDERSARSLAGQCVSAGELPWRASAFQEMAGRLAQGLEPGRATVIDPTATGDADASTRPGQILLQPLARDGRIFGCVLAGEKQSEDDSVTTVDMKLVDAAAQHLTILLENVALYEEQQSMFLGTLGAITASIDAKDRYTCGHSERVSLLAMQLAAAAGLDEATCERVRICGLVHDVGKIGVPESVLRKPGRLTDEEFEQIKLHPVIGHRILRDIPQLSDVLDGVLHHHERWDGAGYPQGLVGDATPLFARIIGIADAYDAMRSTRTYRDAMQHDKVLSEIRRCAGMQFDPMLTPLFMRLDFDEFNRLIARHIRREATGDGLEVAA